MKFSFKDKFFLFMTFFVIITITLFMLIKLNGVEVSYSDVKDYISILLNSSAMIFAIVGLWVSSTYTTFVDSITSRYNKVTSGEFGESTKRLEGLIGVLILSASVMSCILFFQMVKILLPATLEKDFIFAGVSVLLSLGILQLSAIIYVILINVTYINEVYRKIHNKDGEDQF
ncbi:hypothetical protein R7041_16020 [Vibrio sp. 1751]|uniref:hypothetical protein n=1 Tax=unclassified Vibrio TaxID=2614977 RepID=UPI00296444A0|nr:MULTISPECIES: hypothetical protein [unclassified Vibrio]MDW2098844.1 hypothetical protein [Vibrio sp. 1751]MDW2243692.1 hypothetical protein [Vibrio sp. 1287]